MTCKDCIHYDVCKCVNSKVDEMYSNRNGTQYGCGYFKDKSRFVELPCKKTDFSGMFINCKSLKPLPPFDIDEIKKKSLIEKLKSLLKKQR